MRIVIISDTHGLHDHVNVPEGDVIIHCGDFTKTGHRSQVESFTNWFSKLDFRHKIAIAGNHDLSFENTHSERKWNVKRLLDSGICYLRDSWVEFSDVKFYGSPWQPEFCNWAFNLPRGPRLREMWSNIPSDTNVLITHGPPYGILDLVVDNKYNHGRDLHQGCEELIEKVIELKELKLHCFGHLHLNGGQKVELYGKTFVNAAVCDEAYNPVNKPVVVEI